MSRLVSLFLVLASAGVPARAQDLTDDQLLQLFEQQRDALRAAEENGEAVTRGLELIPVEDLMTTPEAVEAAPEGEIAVVESSEAAAAPEGEAPTDVFALFDEAIRVDVRVNFPFDSAVLTDDQLPKLDQLCNVMRGSDIGRFRIVGHTDAAGSDAYNERLSLLRAQEVQRYFVGTCGLEPVRLEAIGMGERFLADPTDPDAADNRRVEFQAIS